MSHDEKLEDFLQLIVQHKHESTADASEHVGPGSFEEGFSTIIVGDLTPAVYGPNVHDISWGS